MQKNNYYQYKLVTDIKTFTKTFEECNSKWWIQTLFDGSHAKCTESKKQFEPWVNSLNMNLELYPLKTDTEKNFLSALKDYKEDCASHSDNSLGGISVLGGAGLTVFSLTVPWFVYIGLAYGGCNYNINTDKLFIASASISGISLATGVGLLGYGVHAIESCQMHTDSNLKSSFIELVNTLNPTQYDPAPPATSEQQKAVSSCDSTGHCLVEDLTPSSLTLAEI